MNNWFQGCIYHAPICINFEGCIAGLSRKKFGPLPRFPRLLRLARRRIDNLKILSSLNALPQIAAALEAAEQHQAAQQEKAADEAEGCYACR